MKISIGKSAKTFFVATVIAAVFGLLACSSVADGDPVENDIPDEDASSSSVAKRSSSSGEPVGESSSSAVKESSASRADSVLTDLVKFVDVPATTLKHGTVSYSVSGFSIAETEVKVMLLQLDGGGHCHRSDLVKSEDGVPELPVALQDEHHVVALPDAE